MTFAVSNAGMCSFLISAYAVSFGIVIIGIILAPFIYKPLMNSSENTREVTQDSYQELSELVKRKPIGLRVIHMLRTNVGLVEWSLYFAASSIVAADFFYFQSSLLFLIGGFIGAVSITLPQILKGTDALLLGKAIFPKLLWMGKQELVAGPKARLAASIHVTRGILTFLAVICVLLWYSSDCQTF